MAKRIRAKLILQLRESGMSYNEIAISQRMSKTSIREVVVAAEEKNLSWTDVQSKSEAEVYKILFPKRAVTTMVYDDPDWKHIHKELAKTGVTLRLLHTEYVDDRLKDNLPAMSYDRFCKRYHEFAISEHIVGRVGHKAARTMEVDWAGPTMALVNPETGELTKVYLFVACLPYSRYSYIEPTLDMKQDTWLLCHVHAFNFFGGSTPCIVSDNLKTGVISHPKEGEIILNDAYREMAAHYSSAVLPARVRKPRDKPSAENEVWSAATYVIAALRNQVFTDINILRQAVADQLTQHNKKPFSKREGSRLQCFTEEEKPLLMPLPAIPYEICTWVYNRKVQLNCHVSYKRNYYSVNYLYVGKLVDLRLTESTLEIFFGNERLATHPLFPPYVTNRYSTRESDLPKDKSYSDWSADRIRNWARRIGDACTEVVNRIFCSVAHDEQGFNATLAILRLSHKYGADRLEKACFMSLSTGKRSPRYRDIEPILKSNQDKIIQEANIPNQPAGYIRGAAYYSEEL